MPSDPGFVEPLDLDAIAETLDAVDGASFTTISEETVRALLAEVQRQRKENDALREQHDIDYEKVGIEVHRRDAAEAERDQARNEVEQLRDALTNCADELDRWGWGDMHYGETPQERRVVRAVAAARARAALTQEENE